MRFSIRELLALAVLAALAMLAYRQYIATERDQERLKQLGSEIQTLEVRVRRDDPALNQAILHAIDEAEALHAARERAVAHFEVIRRKYSTIEPRGAGTLSLRSIPTLPSGTGPAPVTMRMIVPNDPPVWLKCGVHETIKNTQSSRPADQESDLLTSSPFQHSGPFELPLPPGEQILTVTIGAAADGSLPVSINLNEQTLLSSAFVKAGVTGAGWSSVSGRQQIDFDLHKRTPWIMTVNMSLRDPASQQRSEKSHGFSLWLSDHSSDFAEFPTNE